MDDPGGRRAGGIQWLVGLIDEHPDALTYDWRTRFGLPLASIFDGRMRWSESCALARSLIQDPTSRIGAAVSDWKYPISHESAVLADLYDLTVRAHTPAKSQGQVKPYPRPWKQVDGGRSAAPAVDQKTVREALAARGH